MAEIIFKKGTFLPFTASTTFHLGSLGDNVTAGTSMEFDGTTVKVDGKEVAAPSLRGAIKAGWIVLEGEQAQTYQAAPADVKVRPAQSTQEKRGEPIRTQTVVSDDREVGTIKSVRKQMTVEKVADDEGSVVGKVGVPARQNTKVTDSLAADRALREVDGRVREAAKAPLRPVATGDVQEATAGDLLEELLPDAAIAGPIFDVVQQVETPVKKAVVTEAPTDTSILAAQMKVVQALVPGFEWDSSQTWRTRVRKAVAMRNKPQHLAAIMAIETPEVVSQIKLALDSVAKAAAAPKE